MSRDLKGFPVGRHQFFVITTDSIRSYQLRLSQKIISSRRIGNKIGIVLGAHNIKRPSKTYNRLTFVPFESADASNAEEFFGGGESILSEQFNYRKADGMQFYPAPGVSDTELLDQILSAIDYYIINEQTSPIAYPTPWGGKNSNSWTNSILDVIKIAKPEQEDFGDFDGWDAANDVRIHPTYFTGRCTPCEVQNPAYR